MDASIAGDDDDDSDDDMPPLIHRDAPLPSSSDKQDDSSEDDMPPLLGLAPGGRLQDAAEESGGDACDSDGAMPPLFCRRAAPPDSSAAESEEDNDMTSLPDSARTRSSDDDMPPLRSRSTNTSTNLQEHLPPLPAPPSQQQSGAVNCENSDRPPHAGVTWPLQQTWTPHEIESLEHDTELSSEEDIMPPLHTAQVPGTHGASLEGGACNGSGNESDDDDMPPFVSSALTKSRSPMHVPDSNLQPSATQPIDSPPGLHYRHASVEKNDSDGMPQLVQGSQQFASELKGFTRRLDEDMYPHELGGMLEQESLDTTQARHEDVDDSDDDMPPLFFVEDSVLTSLKREQRQHKPMPLESVVSEVVEDKLLSETTLKDFQPRGERARRYDDALDGGGAAPHQQTSARQAREQELAQNFKVGDDVILMGMSSISLNNERGKIVSQDASACKFQVQLEISGCSLTVKPSNLKLPLPLEENACAAFGACQEFHIGSDDDMGPALQEQLYEMKEAAPFPRDEARQESVDDSSDNSMPPMSRLQQPACSDRHIRLTSSKDFEQFHIGSDDDIPSVSRASDVGCATCPSKLGVKTDRMPTMRNLFAAQCRNACSAAAMQLDVDQESSDAKIPPPTMLPRFQENFGAAQETFFIGSDDERLPASESALPDRHFVGHTAAGLLQDASSGGDAPLSTSQPVPTSSDITSSVMEQGRVECIDDSSGIPLSTPCRTVQNLYAPGSACSADNALAIDSDASMASIQDDGIEAALRFLAPASENLHHTDTNKSAFCADAGVSDPLAGPLEHDTPAFGSDDDMPPLCEMLGAQGIESLLAEDDDGNGSIVSGRGDDMPPHSTESDDDVMPPLVHLPGARHDDALLATDTLCSTAGSQPLTAALGSGAASHTDVDSDGDMPPLLQGPVGQSTTRTSEQDDVDSSEDEMPPVVQMSVKGEGVPGGSSCHVEPSDEEDDMPPLLPSLSNTRGTENFQASLKPLADGSEESTDDDLPPLNRLTAEQKAFICAGGFRCTDSDDGNGGNAPKSTASSTPAVHGADSSDDSQDMPPLHRSHQAQAQDSGSGDLPPLKERSEAPGKWDREDECSSDGMPPLSQKESVQKPTSPSKRNGAREDSSSSSDDDMPPLAGTGRSGAPPDNAPFKAGERVRIRGLPRTRQIEGQLARVLPSQGSAPSPYRLTVELEQTGLTVSVKLENLEFASEDEALDTSKEAPEGRCLQSDHAEDSDDSLPPLEFIKPKSGSTLKDELFPGDLVELVDLKTHSLNGERGHVVRLPVPSGQERKDRRVEIKMLSSGKLFSAKWENVQRVPSDDEDSEEEKAKKVRRNVLSKGDAVVLKGLAAIEFNGQRAAVAETPLGPKDRVTVQLFRDGRVLSLRRDKLERLDSDSSSEEDSRKTGLASKAAAKGRGKGPTSKPSSRSSATRGNALKSPAAGGTSSAPARGPQGEDSHDRAPEALKSDARGDAEVTQRCRQFQVGEKVYVDMMQNKEYHGQAVFVLPSDPRRVLDDKITVQLPNGKRIAIKESQLKRDPPVTQQKRAKRNRSVRRQ
eukprot:TRINITY_DN91635_c0_g1_i1.p1 TRINITY_DN91635_c0_g1~~TRINITY_DN91635_c0_g1_i1.p1  ORF type:complete len:1548 (-),score=368.56 TRINITY_DN91635_c0_g1_i1:218-4861(-)